MNKKIYTILSWTWGIIMTIIGAIVAGVCVSLGYKPQKHAGATYFEVGSTKWGGISLGCFFFTYPGAPKDTKDHEFGHSLQNAVWGPLFPFVIAIPSFVRCQKFNNNIRKGIPNEQEYDAIWFEGQATKWGEKTADEWDN